MGRRPARRRPESTPAGGSGNSSPLASVNDQITDAASTVNVLNIASAPAEAMAMTYTAMADAIGLAMQNATATQRNMQIVANSSVSVCCALMIKNAAG